MEPNQGYVVARAPEGKETRTPGKILWIARGGAPWRKLPERYDPWQTVYSRFRKWRDLGVFEAIFQALSIDADFENISIDSTFCKVYQSSNGGEKIRK